jgi:hypothetical protein
MSLETWIALGGLALTIVGIAVRMEQRMGRALTRDEHERICKDRNDRVEKQLDDIRQDTERRHEENRENNRETRETLGEIRESITGTHKMLYDFVLKAHGGGR